MTDQNYHGIGVGTTDSSKWVISNSALNKLNPLLGGHPTKFYKYMCEGGDSRYTPSMETGDLFHLWLEKPNEFAVAELNKPTEKFGDLIERFYNLYIKEDYKTDIMFQEYCKKNYQIDMEDLTKYKEFFRTLNGRPESSDEEIKLFIYTTRYARELAQYGGTPGKKGAYKEATILEKFGFEGLPYLMFLKESSGKLILTKRNKEILDNCFSSVDSHSFARKLSFEIAGLSEQEMFWEETITDGMIIKRKSKIDKIIIDEFNKKVIVIEYKTTSYPISMFINDPNSSYNTYNYLGQIYSYIDGYFKSSKINPQGWKIEAYFIVVQTTEEYPVIVYKVLDSESNQISSLQTLLISLLKRVGHHIKNNNWNITMEEFENGGYVKEYYL